MEVCSLLLISRRRESLGTFPGNLTGYSSRHCQTVIYLDQCSFLRQTVTLYQHGRPLSLHLYYFTSFSQKETCANRKHQMVRYSQPQVHPPQRNLDLQVPMLMPLAHSYFSLKVEYCDLENVFKSTAIFDHFYDHMVTFFFNVKIHSKENSGYVWVYMHFNYTKYSHLQSHLCLSYAGREITLRYTGRLNFCEEVWFHTRILHHEDV